MESERSAGAAATTFNVLFVCTGNTCRSPMAAAVARDELAKRGWQHVRIACHSSQSLTPQLVDWADLVLAMSPTHLSAVADLGGGEKVALLGEFGAADESGPASVRDPFGAGEEVYEATLRQLRALVATSLDRLAPIVHP